jgi:hypothetical protein
VDLKEMVLSALADMQAAQVIKRHESETEIVPSSAIITPEETEQVPIEPLPLIVAQQAEVAPQEPKVAVADNEECVIEDETVFLGDMRERLLVLFEGFQSPNNKAIESKIDLTLNFLEYLLSVVDERLEILKRR